MYNCILCVNIASYNYLRKRLFVVTFIKLRSKRIPSEMIIKADCFNLLKYYKIILD